MASYTSPSEAPTVVNERVAVADSGTSGVSWAAIFVGAAAAAALSLVLIILGFGLGLSAVSPWSSAGASATAIGVSTIVWIAFTQLAASAMGGYLAGRLRAKWTGLHTDEVYFRDTAHGFMAWAVASLGTAAFLGSAVTGIVSGAVHAGATMAGGAMNGAVASASHADTTSADRLSYFVDSLFRKDSAHAGTPTSAATRAEAMKIFANDVRTGALPDNDRQYLGGVIGQETGLAQTDGEQRATNAFNQVQAAIKDTENRAKQAADDARKAATHASLWMFVALMLGAFFASLAATLGGRRRDGLA